MLSFVVLAAKPGRSLAPELLRSLDRRDQDDVAFCAEDHVLWRDDSGRTAFLGWQTATNRYGAGSQWHHDERGLTAFTRHLWPKGGMWSPGESWASQLHGHLDGVRIADASEDLGGVFVAATIGADGRGGIFTDPLSATVVYRSENDDLVAYASTSALAARSTTPPGLEPDRDPWGVGWHVVMGYLVGDSTGFVGTTALPAGTWVELDRRFGSRVRSANPTPWCADVPLDRDEAVELAHADLAAEIRSVAALPAVQHRADITGGRDSRLILALMVEQGLEDRFTFRTMGDPAMPDRQVGDSIVPLYGLTHRTEEPVPMEPELFSERLAAHVFHSSGMLNAWDLQGGLGISSNVTVAGFYGEVLRTYFHFYPPDLDRAHLLARFLRGAGLATASRRGTGPAMLTPDAHRYYTERLEHELIGRFDDGASDSQDRLDSFYLRHRIRRWMATMEELNGPGRVHPLYSPAATRVAFALGGTSRRNEEVPFAVMCRAAPALAKAPFADRGWPAGAYAGLPDADDYAVPPVTTRSPNATKWQIPRLAANHELVQSYVLDGPPDEMWEVFDRRAVERTVRGENPSEVRDSQRIYGLLTAAVWLGRYEQPIRIGDAEPRPFTGPTFGTRRAPVEIHRDVPIEAVTDRSTTLGRLGIDYSQRESLRRIVRSDAPILERVGQLGGAGVRRTRRLARRFRARVRSRT